MFFKKLSTFFTFFIYEIVTNHLILEINSNNHFYLGFSPYNCGKNKKYNKNLFHFRPPSQATSSGMLDVVDFCGLNGTLKILEY